MCVELVDEASFLNADRRLVTDAKAKGGLVEDLQGCCRTCFFVHVSDGSGISIVVNAVGAAFIGGGRRRVGFTI